MIHRLGVVAATVVLVAACSSNAPATPTPASAAASSQPDDVYSRLFARVGPNGEVDKQLALDAFSLAIAPLPGVAVPTGPPPQPWETTDGTFAVDWISSVYDQLTAAQQSAVEAALAPGPNDVLIPRPDTATSTVAPDVVPDRQIADARIKGGLTADTRHADYAAILREAEDAIASRVGEPLGLSWALWVRDTDSSPNPYASGITVASTDNVGLPMLGNFGCVFQTFPALDAMTLIDPDAVRATLAHEMFHCFQDMWGQSSFTWVAEGQAEWAGEALWSPSSLGEGWFVSYVTSLSRRLFSRNYDAGGFFWHLQESGVNEWSAAKAVVQARSNEDAFTFAGGDGDLQLDTSGSSLVRQPGFDVADWYSHGGWPIRTDRSPPSPIFLADGQDVKIGAAPVTDATYVVRPSVQIVESHLDGHGLIGAPGFNALHATEQWLCVDPSGCPCPPGHDYHGPPLEAMATPFYVGVAGGLSGATGDLVGHSLDPYCEDLPAPVPTPRSCFFQPVPTPRPLPGGPTPKPTSRPTAAPNPTQCPKVGKYARSGGDPHLMTVDGAHLYDFMGAGEYVLLRSPDDSFEVQARQEPVASYNFTRNTAIAARVAGRRVGVYLPSAPDDPLTVMLDGATVDASQPIDLGSGASLASYGENDVEIDAPDGTQLLISADADCCLGLTVGFDPESSVVMQSSGLLAAIASPDALALPALPDGTVLAPTTDLHQRFLDLYQTLGPAWLDTDQSTLFDYQAGQSRAGFVLPDFPKESDTTYLDDLPADKRADAERVCLPLTDPELFKQCVYDYAVTGDQSFVTTYESVASIEQPGTAAPTPTPVTKLCDAVTSDEISAITGQTATSTGPNTFWLPLDSCSWDITGSGVNGAVNLYESVVTLDSVMGQSPGGQVVSGVGDSAYWIPDQTILYFTHAGKTYYVSLFLVGGDNQAIASQVALAALARI